MVVIPVAMVAISAASVFLVGFGPVYTKIYSRLHWEKHFGHTLGMLFELAPRKLKLKN